MPRGREGFNRGTGFGVSQTVRRYTSGYAGIGSGMWLLCQE